MTDIRSQFMGVPLWVGESQAAELLGVHVETLRKLRNRDKQLSRRLPGMVRRKYSTARIQQLIAEAMNTEEF